MNYHSTDFGYRNCGSWKDGQMPHVTTRIFVVSYDQNNLAYTVESDEMDAFHEWVATNWEPDRLPRDDDEDATEYLDRLGVRVWPYE